MMDTVHKGLDIRMEVRISRYRKRNTIGGKEEEKKKKREYKVNKEKEARMEERTKLVRKE